MTVSAPAKPLKAAKVPKARRARAVDDGTHELVTPEGVDLKLSVGGFLERAGALIVDLIVIVGILIVLTLLVAAVDWATKTNLPEELLGVIWLLGFFLLRNFYFTAFELRPGAATPGKRLMKLRVVSRNGGRLTSEGIFVRNALRELELFLPITFLVSQGEAVDRAITSLGLLWSLIFALFPLFNRNRLRAGDLLAGTMVVRTPKPALLPDLARDGRGALDELVFTSEQLDAYGIKELQVLEGVLRRGDRKSMTEVAARIRTKIGWTRATEASDRAFLTAYYAALRGRLERQMLLGRRRVDKHDRG